MLFAEKRAQKKNPDFNWRETADGIKTFFKQSAHTQSLASGANEIKREKKKSKTIKILSERCIKVVWLQV